MWLSVFVFALLATVGCRPERLHSRRYSIPPTLVSILTIRCWVAYVARNGKENYPHFIWVLVVNGFAGTGLEGSKPTPRPKFLATSGEIVLIQWGLNPANPPGKSKKGEVVARKTVLLRLDLSVPIPNEFYVQLTCSQVQLWYSSYL